MKTSMRRFFLLIALVMSVIVVQSAFAETITGAIEEITTKPNTITIDETVFNGIKISYLRNQYSIDLETGMQVTLDYYEFECTDGTIKNMITDITVGDVTVHLR